MATVLEAPQTATLVLPEVGATLNRKALIAREVELLQQRERRRTFHTQLLPKEFVTRVFDTHRDTIERWGGLRWHSPLYNGEFSRDANARTISTTISKLNSQFAEECYDIHNIRNFEWAYSDNMPSSAFPWLAPYHPSALFRERLWNPERWGYNSSDYVAITGFQSIRVRKGASVPRAVMAWLKKYLSARGQLDHPYAHLLIGHWEKVFATLGEYWRTSNGLQLTLSVAPSDFAWMGEIEVEGGAQSCFQNGGQSEASKFNIGVTPHAFVGFGYLQTKAAKAGPNELLNNGALPSSRFWGFAFPEGALATNMYRGDWNSYKPAIESALRSAFGYSEAHSLLKNDSFNLNPHAYSNADAHALATSTIEGRELTIQLRNLVRDFRANNSTYDRPPCRGCHGAIGDGEKRYSCSHCGNTGYCIDCIKKCRSCGSRCRDCAGERTYYDTCNNCNNSCCNACYPGYRKYNCKACLTPHSVCTNCVTKCAHPDCEVAACRDTSYDILTRDGVLLTVCYEFSCAGNAVACEEHRCDHAHNEVRTRILEEAYREDARITALRIRQQRRAEAEARMAEATEIGRAIRTYGNQLSTTQLARNPAMRRFLYSWLASCDCGNCAVLLDDVIEELLEPYGERDV